MKRLVVTLAVGAMGAILFPISPASAAVDTSDFCVNVSDVNPFTDVLPSNVHYENILCLNASGITNGETATIYGPGNPTSRGQMASFVARMIDKANELELTDLAELPATGPDAFPDDDGNTHEDSINRLAAAGVVEGDLTGDYNPGDSVNRSQMASYISRAIEFLIGAALPAGADAFPDDTGSVHEANINKLAAIGVVEGKTDGKYYPGEIVNRSQMASFLIRTLAWLHAAGDIGPVPPGAPTGPVTVNPTAIGPEHVVSGTVADPSTIEFFSVEGCGLNLTGLTPGASGGFSFVLPPQTVGPCNLIFSISYTDGSSVQQTIAVTVAANTLPVTAAPNLLSVDFVQGLNIAIFTFDQTVVSVSPGFWGGFHLYDVGGESPVTATSAIIPGTAPNTVVATFPSFESFITRAGIDKDVVESLAGKNNHPDGAAVFSQNAGNTRGPDLVSVDNLRTDSLGRQVADFTFDRAVASPSPAQIGRFSLVEASTAPPKVGTVVNPTLGGLGDQSGIFQGLALVDQSANGRTVTVLFGLELGSPSVNLSEVIRGTVEQNAVTAGGLHNILNSEDACLGGTLLANCTRSSGRTDTPDFVSATIAGPTSVRFQFDEPVDANFINPGGFILYTAAFQNGDNTERVIGTEFLRSSTDGTAVDIDFAFTAINAAFAAENESLAEIVTATMEDSFTLNGGPNNRGTAVFGTTDLQMPNLDHEVPLIGQAAGVSDLPDLLNVVASQIPGGQWFVTYQFDEIIRTGGNSGPAVPSGFYDNVLGGFPAAPGDFRFYVVDVGGSIFEATTYFLVGDTVIVASSPSVFVALGITGAPVPGTAGFGVATIADSVIGAVDDSLGFGSGDWFTEGADLIAKHPL